MYIYTGQYINMYLPYYLGIGIRITHSVRSKEYISATGAPERKAKANERDRRT